MTPQISIVVPLYNEEKIFSLLKERLQKLINSCPLTIEVVLVDDGSKDNTAMLMTALGVENMFRLIAKMFPNFRRSETGSDFSVIPQKSILNKFFYGVFHAEYRLLKFLKCPIGVSYLHVGQK